MERDVIYGMERLLAFLDRLDAHSIRYSLARDRPGAIMVRVRLPGERWEIGFLADGTVEIETFTGVDAVVSGEAAQELLERLFAAGGSDA